MNRRQRGRGSLGSASPTKKRNVNVVSEEEVFSPEILPIDDPWKEKKVIEERRTPFSVYLIGKLGAKEIGFTEEAVHNRIREVYRLCFKSTGEMKVINDCVAFHPNLAFNTPWLAEVVKTHTTFEDPEEGSPRTRLLEALSAGFLRAAYSKVRTSRRIRSMKLEWAKVNVEIFKDELLKFYSLPEVDWAHADKEEAVSEKVKELVKRYPRVNQFREGLSEHLLHKRISHSALFIVSKLWGVRIHDLKSKAQQ